MPAPAYFLLSDGCFRRDQYKDALAYLDEALALARKVGDRPYEWASLAERTYALYMLGSWNEAQTAAEEFTAEQLEAGGVMLSLLQTGVEIHVQRGELDEARQIFSMFGRLEESTDVQDRTVYLGVRACLTAGRRSVAGSVGRRRGRDRGGTDTGPLFPDREARLRRGTRGGPFVGGGGDRSRSCWGRSSRSLPACGRRISTRKHCVFGPGSTLATALA